MRTITILAGLALLFLAACDNAENSATTTSTPAEEAQPAGTSGERAQEAIGQAGDRLRNAAGALIEDPDRPDAPGDSEADANETPEVLETPSPQ